MANKREWDLASVHSLESGAEWLREKSGALVVIVVRRDDAVLAADPQLAPADAKELIYGYMDGLVSELAAARVAKRKAARVELGEMHE